MTNRGRFDRLTDVDLYSRATVVFERTFGDTGGLVVFLTTIVVLGGLWRIDVLLNDSVTVGNLLVNVAEGHLAVTEAPYALTAGEQPGLVTVDGQLYGRNYGQVYLAAPVLLVLDRLAGIVDLRLLLAAGWSLSLLGLARACAGLLDYPRLSDLGALVALAAFLGSLVFATDIGWLERPRPIVAIGISTLLLAAVAALALYRLLTWAHDRRVGIAGGLGLVLATPIGFWGTFPKRHVLSATALLIVMLCFAVSRERTDRRAIVARAGAYATIGFLSSVHAFEAAFALAVFLPLDLASAPSNDRRTLAVLVLVFSLSILPMLATNAAISGDPLQPPRTLPGADGGLSLDPTESPPGGGSGSDAAGGGAGGGSTESGGGSTGSDGSGGGVPYIGLLSPLFELLDRVLWVGTYMLGALTAGLAASTEAERLFHVLVRSGWIPGLRYHLTDFETLELAFLEALPLAGALLTLPAVAITRVRESSGSVAERVRAGLSDPVHQTDVLAAALGVTLFLAYLPRLPLNAMITLRYVVPIMPLTLYAVCRLPPIRASIREAPGLIARGYLATVLVGGLGLALALHAIDPAQGEAVQLHAVVGLTASLLLAVGTVSWYRYRHDAAVAVALAFAAGATTLFIVFSALTYFADGNHALDLVRLVAETLPAVG